MLRNICSLFLLTSLVLCGGTASAEVQTKSVVYQDGDVTLEGFLAFDPAKVETERARRVGGSPVDGAHRLRKGRCKQLAELGLVALRWTFTAKAFAPPTQPQQVSLPASTNRIAICIGIV